MDNCTLPYHTKMSVQTDEPKAHFITQNNQSFWDILSYALNSDFVNETLEHGPTTERPPHIMKKHEELTSMSSARPAVSAAPPPPLACSFDSPQTSPSAPAGATSAPISIETLSLFPLITERFVFALVFAAANFPGSVTAAPPAPLLVAPDASPPAGCAGPPSEPVTTGPTTADADADAEESAGTTG